MIRQRTERGNREHRFVSDHLSEYIDERLSDRDRLRVEAHLSTCDDCRADLRSLRWTQRLLRQAPAVKIPRSFVLREVDVAPRAAPGVRLRLIAVQWATAAVALLFVLVLGIDLLGGGAPRATQQPEAAMLAATAPQAAEETVIDTVVVEQERAAPMPSGGGGARSTPTAEEEMAQLAAAPTVTEPAAKLAGPREDAEGTPTPAPAQEEMAVEALAATPAPEPTEVPLMAQAPQEPSEQPVLTPDTEPAAPPQTEPVMLPTESYGAELQPRGGQIAWWIAEVVLGVALLILVGAMIWLRQRT